LLAEKVEGARILKGQKETRRRKAVLGHSKIGIEGTFDPHQYEEECKVWLQKWADFMDQLIA